MRTIQPIQIWKNGEAKEASVLSAKIINDDLSTSCVFYYELNESTIIPSEIEGQPDTVIYGEKITDGNITMSGTNYLNWDGTNDYAYTFISNQLNLILI